MATSLGLLLDCPESDFSKILTPAQLRQRRSPHSNAQPGVDIPAAPNIHNFKRPAGALRCNGPETAAVMLDVFPTVTPDGFSIRAVVIPSVKTAGQTWQTAATRDIFDGHTLVLGAPVANSPASQGKIRMVFVTPRIVDPAGNAVHSATDLHFVTALTVSGSIHPLACGGQRPRRPLPIPSKQIV